ncbi:MAG: hypothetical protein PHD67_09900 [Oscillospiraceae bacterium]|nr:hypothetical protein [Oscillospiraceae bacterium]
MRRIKIGLLALAALMLSACADLQQTTEDLMRPPQLTQQQAELFTALENAIGVNGVKLKYPRSGRYRSAFVLYDLDWDGVEEALVFYDPQTDGVSTKINILDYNETEGWISVYETAGEGSEVDRVDFRHLTSKDRWDILIGWVDPSAKEPELKAYSYEDGVLSALAGKSYYTQMETVDLNGDGLTEVILAGSNGTTQVPFVKLFGRTAEGFGQISRSFLNGDITEYTRMQVGEMAPGIKAVFVDAQLSGGSTITETLVYSDGRLDRLYEETDEAMNDRFIRLQPVPCEDVDGDSVLEIPWMEELPAYSETGGAQREKQYLTRYAKVNDLMTMEQAQAPSVWSGLVDLESGFRFRFPEGWVGAVTVEKALESNEWRFYTLPPAQDETQEDGEEEPEEEEPEGGKELLRIRVYGQDEVRDKFETYEKVAKKGTHEYYVMIPQDGEIPEGMAVTLAQCGKLLELIQQ